MFNLRSRRALVVALSVGTALLAACADPTSQNDAPNPDEECSISGTYGGSSTISCDAADSGTYGGSGT